VSIVKELFAAATSHKLGSLKSKRKSAFERLRQLSQYGSTEEMAEAQLALNHSHLYQVNDGNVAAILEAIKKSENDGC
jgi:hypothetical protein